MDATLSQADSAPRHERSAIARPRRPSAGSRLIPLLLLAGLVVGCNRVETDGAQRTADADTSTHEASQPFAWPDDDAHPRLFVAIDDGSTRGTIEIELMPELAPFTVLQVADLARNGYYDGTTFHRVIPDFMIQGGDPNSRDRDPNNDGYGDPELYMDDEFSDAPFLRGVVAMGNEGRVNSTGGQFFIMHGDQRDLDGRYTVIGRVVSGMDVVDAIAGVETDRSGRWGPKDRPIENVVMTRVSTGPPASDENGVPKG